MRPSASMGLKGLKFFDDYNFPQFFDKVIIWHFVDVDGGTTCTVALCLSFTT